MIHLVLIPLLAVAFFAGKRVGMVKAHRLLALIRMSSEAQ